MSFSKRWDCTHRSGSCNFSLLKNPLVQIGQQGQEHRLHPASTDVTSKSVSGMKWSRSLRWHSSSCKIPLSDCRIAIENRYNWLWITKVEKPSGQPHELHEVPNVVPDNECLWCPVTITSALPRIRNSQISIMMFFPGGPPVSVLPIKLQKSSFFRISNKIHLTTTVKSYPLHILSTTFNTYAAYKQFSR